MQILSASAVYIMIKNSFYYSLILIISSIWLGWTLLIDMVVIRTIFGIINDFFTAGDLGVALFSKFNSLELISSSVIIAILGLNLKNNRNSLFIFILSIILWSIVMFYFTFLTPKLIFLTDLWKESELSNKVIPPHLPDIQQEHQYYHRLYISLDSLKSVLLFLMIFLSVWKRNKWF